LLKEIHESLMNKTIERLSYINKLFGHISSYQTISPYLRSKSALMKLNLQTEGQADLANSLAKENSADFGEMEVNTLPKHQKKSIIIKLKDRFLKHILETSDSMYSKE